MIWYKVDDIKMNVEKKYEHVYGIGNFIRWIHSFRVVSMMIDFALPYHMEVVCNEPYFALIPWKTDFMMPQ